MFQPSQRTCGRGEFRRLAHGFCNHFAATLCLLAAGLCAAPAPAPPALPGSDPRFTPLSQRTLRVDAATDAYPYSYIDESGKLTGFAVDLLDALAAASHLHLEREPTLALEGARRFAAGEFDLGQFAARPPGHDADPEYSLPVLVLQGALFVREHDSRFETMADLRARRAVVATPPQGQLFALAEGLDPGLVRMRSAPDALQELAAGRVDAVLLARLTGLAQIQHLGLRGLTTAGPPLEGFTITYTFVVHKDEGRLMNRPLASFALKFNGRPVVASNVTFTLSWIRCSLRVPVNT